MNILDALERQALHEALDDEYRSWATYDQVMTDFGAVRPFSNIREAESRHIEALCALFATYGLPVPANPWPGKVERYASPQAACEAGVVGETANGQMYDRLMAQTQRTDILTVLRRLQQASQQRHLPAFRRGVQRDARGGGMGWHGGRGAGHRRAGV